MTMPTLAGLGWPLPERRDRCLGAHEAAVQRHQARVLHIQRQRQADVAAQRDAPVKHAVQGNATERAGHAGQWQGTMATLALARVVHVRTWPLLPATMPKTLLQWQLCRAAQQTSLQQQAAHLRGAAVGSITQACRSKSSKLSHASWCSASAASNCCSTSARPLPAAQRGSNAAGRSAAAAGGVAG